MLHSKCTRALKYEAQERAKREGWEWHRRMMLQAKISKVIHIYMETYIYIYIYIYMDTWCVHIYMDTCMCIYIYVWRVYSGLYSGPDLEISPYSIYTCMHIYIYIWRHIIYRYMYVYIHMYGEYTRALTLRFSFYICICTCIHVYTCVCMYVCTHTHTHTHTHVGAWWCDAADNQTISQAYYHALMCVCDAADNQTISQEGMAWGGGKGRGDLRAQDIPDALRAHRHQIPTVKG